MSDRVYAIHTDEECERLEAQALLAGASDHVRHVPALPGMRILDAGCGSGSMARAIAKVAPESVVIGVDLRGKYVDYASRRAEAEGLRNVTFETGDVRELPFADGVFDIVWTKYLLQWVADPMSAVRDFARVLKPGGLLVSANFDGFAVTNEPPDPAIQPIAEFVFNGLVDPYIGRKMAGMCRECGLIDIDVKMETDRAFTVIGSIDQERRRNWEIQWSGAKHRTAELLGSQALADAFIEKFMAYQDRPDTATYCTLYIASARKPC
ncbi:methyltransferase domain-containing protein [Bradyrhizobium jicamae]|uniref:Methyltransferase domain-containing protein n=1 Tax=Bradyrhizobium jicamae TaxID=280332 RepID=A0ABS5FEN9_9BRAD|nr:methyltransferase domain-containing protein [Bradyrhizobium jicamae]MBR0795254.1 methyltransferase domain-containing protein [Bradyrhizobium jicamae]MBR0931762.1 methyltransferase domain-containing protein [Bradyrhizobium jicamae]